MSKNTETQLNKYIKDNLSPDPDERSFISGKYDQLKSLLEGNDIFQSGSFARFTSIKPVNDLDVVWVLPRSMMEKAVSPSDLDSSRILSDLAEKLRQEYKGVNEQVTIKPQSHSVGIYFGSEEEFSIDIVPAVSTDRVNDFGDPIFAVPEILKLSKQKRAKFYTKSGDIEWIETDPKGYSEASRVLNEKNEHFRKVVKFMKAWKRNCKRNYPNFPLKSFHMEMVVYDLFSDNEELRLVNGIELFLKKLPEAVEVPAIKDRADGARYIDSYVEEITEFDKREIAELSELALERLHEIEGAAVTDEAIEKLLSALDDDEESIVNKIDKYSDDIKKLEIIGSVRPVSGKGKPYSDFRGYALSSNNNRVIRTPKDRSIDFDLAKKEQLDEGARLIWKVKNRTEDPSIGEPRGELDNKQDPETTRYKGQHFVDCYAVKDGICIGFGRHYIVI